MTIDTNALRDELFELCKDTALSIARGPEFDERVILIRSDGSAWGESTSAPSIEELNLNELSLCLANLSAVDLADPDFIQECAYWRHVPGFHAWLSGGPHPATLANGRAIALRQGVVRINRDYQRITLNGQHAIVPESVFTQLKASPELIAAALDDPRSFVQSQRDNLMPAWREATFEHAIFFSGDALPAIPPEEILLARRLGDGSWLFEHPKRTQWLCRMEAAINPMTTQLYLHNGIPVYDFASEPPERD